MRLLNDHPHDEVSRLLAQVQVRSTVYCLSELGSPWGFRVDGADVAKFHLVLDGEATLAIDPDEPIGLRAGDLALLPHGHAHAMYDDAGDPVEHLDQVLAEHPVDDQGRLTYGGDGAVCRLLCGGFSLDGLPAILRTLMPSVIRLDAETARITPWLEPVFRLLRSETSESPNPGAQAVFAKIADIFLTQALRSFLIGVQEGGPIALRPMLDSEVARAVELVHHDPARRWTVAGLGSAVGLSRSAFSARFREGVGEPPARYVARVRLARAAGYLVTTSMTLSDVAERTGYDSDESLSKAFKRTYGLAPGAYRERASRRTLLAAVETVA